MYEFKKEGFESFLKHIARKYDLIAPVYDEEVLKYQLVDDVSKINLKRPVYSLKKFMLPPKQMLYTYSGTKIKHVKDDEKKKAFIASRCDTNMFGSLDKLYIKGPIDKKYLKNRKQNLLIEFICTKRGDNCFCCSMDLKDYFDINIIEHDGKMYADPRTLQGKKELKKYVKTQKETLHIIKEECKKEPIPLEKVDYKQSENCVTCGACTMMCPTCNCYDIIDIQNLNVNDGKRIITWDSCQYQDFTRVGGGYVFRETKEKRLRHRLNHKLKWFKEKNGIHMCVGCGRCITNCPAKITFLKEKKGK